MVAAAETSARLSVVLPTLNCMAMLPAHLKTMQPWLKHVSEIVVVDSYSEDGTAEYLRKNLRHPNVRFFSRPRGLYQAWNFGIEQTTGDWIYVSTIGDGIAPALLQRLCELGDLLDCDVVASRPNFIGEAGRQVPRLIWPIDHILNARGGQTPVRLAGVDVLLFGLVAIPNALLGSSASNVYRGPHLRARPFPTEFGTVGDTGWSLRYGLETNYGFTAERGSFFRLHAKAYAQKDYEVANLNAKLLDTAIAMLKRPGHPPVIQAGIARHRLLETARILAERYRLAGRTENRPPIGGPDPVGPLPVAASRP